MTAEAISMPLIPAQRPMAIRRKRDSYVSVTVVHHDSDRGNSPVTPGLLDNSLSIPLIPKKYVIIEKHTAAQYRLEARSSLIFCIDLI